MHRVRSAAASSPRPCPPRLPPATRGARGAWVCMYERRGERKNLAIISEDCRNAFNALKRVSAGDHDCRTQTMKRCQQ
eukprot:scaffold19258_cov154-Isochrysis_galbana.AAC.4